jgi:photosystem II stability/assembly factor-like uncharacterized protein
MKHLLLFLLFFSVSISVSFSQDWKDEILKPTTFANGEENYNNLQSGTKIVLCEVFTSTTCPPCASWNPAFDAWLNSYANKERVAVIKYHVWWPATGDPYYNANQQQAKDRVNYYSCNAVPTLYTDGSADNSYSSTIPNLLAASSPLDITISGNIAAIGGQLTISVTNNGMATLPTGTLVLHTAIVESGLEYTGSNGDPVHHYVMRKMLPDAGGETFTILANETKTFTRKISWDTTWNLDLSSIIAFVQVKEKKSVVQAVIKNLATKPILSLSSTGLKTSFQGGEYSINIANAGIGTLSWLNTITDGSSWIQSSSSSGTNSGEVKISYSKNTGSLRTGKVKFEAAGALKSPVEFTLTQAGAPDGFTYKAGAESYNFYFITSPKENIYYGVTASGKVVKSTDIGETWSSLYSQSYSLTSVSFPDENTGYTVGAGGKIYKTTDAGNTWSLQSSGTSNTLWDVDFSNANFGIAGGNSGTLLRTTDGGKNWTSLNTGYTVYYKTVVCFDALTAIAAGGGGTIIKTTDGGNSWQKQTSGTTTGIYSMSFINKDIGWMAVSNGTTLKTTNGGSSWISQGTGVSDIIESISFYNENNGICVGDNGLILKTTDGGSKWTQYSSGFWSTLISVSYNKYGAVIAGYSGEILKSSTWNSVDKNVIITPGYFSLSQNYPNPFNPLTTIQYQIPKTNNVKLVIYNTLGQEIKTLINEKQNSGYYNITWDGKDNSRKAVASGIYFYILIADEFVSVRKLNLLK